MFGFFKKKSQGPPPLPKQSGGPPPLPDHAPNVDAMVPWQSYIFTTSAVTHYLKESKVALIRTCSQEKGINFMWCLACPPKDKIELARMSLEDLRELDCRIHHESGHCVVAMKLPQIRYPYEVLYVVVLLGPCSAAELDDPDWDKAGYRLFFLQAGLGVMEMKEWREGQIIDQGVWRDEGLEDFANEVLRRCLSLKGVTPSLCVSHTDQTMNQAMERARREFPEVLRRYEAGEFVHFGLKVAIHDGDNIEHFWLSNARVEGGRLVGNIQGRPEHVTNVKAGELVSAGVDKLSDWSYKTSEEGKMHGSYTLRATLPTMSPDMAQKIQAILSED